MDYFPTLSGMVTIFCSSTRLSLLVFILSTWCLFLSSTNAQIFYCPLDDVDILVSYNTDLKNGTFTDVFNDDVSGSDGNHSATGNHSVTGNHSATPYLKARKCLCGGMSSPYFCLITKNNENTCKLDRRKDIYPSCYYRSGISQVLTSTLWPFTYVTLAVLFLSIFTTPCGIDVRNYVLSFCFPRINQRIVDRMLRNQNALPERFFAANNNTTQQYFWNGRRRAESVTLRFKTKKFEGEGHDVSIEETGAQDALSNVNTGMDHVDDMSWLDSDEDKVSCAICMAPFFEGDRVSDLQCSHQFHVSCLKTWLMRRNVCPLCQMTDIATVHTTHRNSRMDESENRREWEIAHST